MDDDNPFPDPVEIPITPELDLHTFRPSEISSLIPEYLREAQALGMRNVRIIHGKGTGTLRTGVHRLLDRLPELVDSYALGDQTTGSWGATCVTLRAEQIRAGEE